MILQDRAPEDKGGQSTPRVKRLRARRLEALLERERLVDWAFISGEDELALTERRELALWAWRREHKIRGEFGWLEPWYYPLVGRRHRHKVSRTGEPWIARVDKQGGGRCRRPISTEWSSDWERQAVLSTLGKGWGRTLRTVIEDGKRHLVPAALAAGPAIEIPITPDLARLYRGELVWEYQRWRWRLRGDYWWAWGRPALTDWNDKVDHAHLKAPIPGAVGELFQFIFSAAASPVGCWRRHYRLPPASYRAPIAYALDPEKGDWGHRLDPHNSGVSRLSRVTPYFDQILRTLNRQVEKECADAIDDEHNVDGKKLDRPLPYNVNGRRVVLDFFSDGSLAVHREDEKRNRARMRGAIPLTSATSANSGIIGHVQRSHGWAARPPIPNADVALTVLRSGELPTIASVNAYWCDRLGRTPLEIRARALTEKCKRKPIN